MLCVCAVYLAEMSPPEFRGTIVTVNTLFCTGGQFFSGVIDGAFSEVADGWRYMLGLAAVPAALQFVGFLCLPESARWLVMMGRDDDAAAVLTSMCRGSGSGVLKHADQRRRGSGSDGEGEGEGGDGDSSAHKSGGGGGGGSSAGLSASQLHSVRKDLSAIKRSIEGVGSQMSAWQVLRAPGLRPQLLLGMMLQLIQQLAGGSLSCGGTRMPFDRLVVC
jgi:hypothetical protein